MARRRKEEARETRERILDAAITVFHERGVARPSLTDIAELAGVTRGAVYGHFRNKADLLSAMAARIDLPADSLCEGGLGPCTDPLGELRSRWLALYREIVRNRQWQLIFEILFHRCELVDESGEIRDRMLEGHGRGIDRVHRLLQQAVGAGQLAPDIDTRVAAHFLHAALIGLLHDWLLRPEAFDFATQGERFIDATLELIAHSPQLRRAQ